MNFIVSLISFALGIGLILEQTKLVSLSFLPISATMIGAAYLIVSQLFFLVLLNVKESATFMGNVIRFVIMLPGILYIINSFFPIGFGEYLSILVAAFLFLEGIYGLH